MDCIVNGVAKSRIRLTSFQFLSAFFMVHLSHSSMTIGKIIALTNWTFVSKVFLPGESQGRGSLVGCHLWGCTELDMIEVT